jgi:hypothetical protein
MYLSQRLVPGTLGHVAEWILLLSVFLHKENALTELPPREPFETTFRPSHTSKVVWLVLGFVVLAVGGVALWRWKQSTELPPVAPAEESKPAPAAPALAASNLPATEGDALARQLGAELSSASEWAKWLAEPDIVRRFVAAVNLVAEGNSPRPVLSFLTPADHFEIVRRGHSVHASAKSYARYDAVTRVLTSIDATAAGKVYGRIKPYLDSAFAQISRPGQSFNTILHQAIASLIATPVPEAEPELEEKGLVYAYQDPKLEQLSAAQKHLLRMGPENARALQAWLRKLDESIPK